MAGSRRERCRLSRGFRYGAGGGQILELTRQGNLTTQMCTTIDKEVPPDAPDIPKVLDLLKQNGVIVAA